MRIKSYQCGIIFSATLFIYSSCSSTKPFYNILSHPTNYADTVANMTDDKLWVKVVDFCSEEGLSIKLIDRNEGLVIIAKNNARCTYEMDEIGTLKDSTALIVVQKQINGITNTTDRTVSAEWNIRIRKNRNESNELNVNLIYARNQQVYSTKYDKYISQKDLHAFSTGNLERKFFEYLAKNAG